MCWSMKKRTWLWLGGTWWPPVSGCRVRTPGLTCTQLTCRSERLPFWLWRMRTPMGLLLLLFGVFLLDEDGFLVLKEVLLSWWLRIADEEEGLQSSNPRHGLGFLMGDFNLILFF